MLEQIIIKIIRIYKKISAIYPQKCRYYPSCSDYAIEAIGRYGMAHGIFLFTKRIIRCNQFFEGGYDPVK